MPEFDANDDIRLPGLRPERAEEPVEGRPPQLGGGSGAARARRAAARSRRIAGASFVLASRRRPRRLACFATRALFAAPRNRRAGCQKLPAPPPGQRG